MKEALDSRAQSCCIVGRCWGPLKSAEDEEKESIAAAKETSFDATVAELRSEPVQPAKEMNRPSLSKYCPGAPYKTDLRNESNSILKHFIEDYVYKVTWVTRLFSPTSPHRTCGVHYCPVKRRIPRKEYWRCRSQTERRKETKKIKLKS